MMDSPLSGAAGGTRNSDDVIVFGPFDDGNLYRISAKKPGTATPVDGAATGTFESPAAYAAGYSIGP